MGWLVLKFEKYWFARLGIRVILPKVVDFWILLVYKFDAGIRVKSILAYCHRLKKVIENNGAHIELNFVSEWHALQS